MTVLAVAVHHHRPEVPAMAHEAISWCQAHEIQTIMSSPDAALVGRPELGVSDAELGGADACLSLGGDGTILRAIGVFGSCEVPIIGVNAGKLGYLAEFDPSQLRLALDRWRADELVGDNRMMLAYRFEADGPTVGLALNEVVMERAESGHTVSVDTHINGRRFTTMLADALIVSTPTGSTAYSLSAGGPIVEPTTQAILLTPVAAHMVFNRTMVLGASSSVELVVAGYRSATVTVDGRPVATLKPGQSLHCEVSPVKARFLVTGERDFHSILKEKFGLTDR